jgi:hypothetical protein
MRNLFIFGDSFLAPYSHKELLTFNWKREYVDAEHKLDNPVQDINYWLTEFRTRNSYRLINTAVSGTNNDYIFEQFFRFSKYFKFGDYIVLLITKKSRARFVNRFYDPKTKMRTQNKYLDVVFPLHDDLNESIRQQTYFTPDEVEKLALETSSRQHDLKVKWYINGMMNLSKLSKLNLLTITIDEDFRESVIEPDFFHNVPRINEKFSHLTDKHPTYEGNKLMASRILKHFNINTQLSI